MMRGHLNLLPILIIGFLILSTLPSSAAASPSLVVQKTWGGTSSDSYAAVTTDASGNIYAAGITYSFGPGSPSCSALLLVKYSPAGAILWQRIWTNGSSAQAQAIAVDSSGNVYVEGYANANTGFGCGGAYSPTLVKFSSTGNLQWQKGFKNAQNAAYFNLIGIAIDSSNDIYIDGETTQYGAGSNDFIIFKLNSTGNVQWEKTWGGTGSDVGYGAAVDSSGNLYVAGSSLSFGGGALVKFNAAGNSVLFQKFMTGIYVSQVGLDPSGNIYVGGLLYTGGHNHAIVLKFDSTSGFRWAKTWGGSNGTDWLNALAVDSSGNTAITGYTDSYGQGGSCPGTLDNICYDLFYAKINTTGGLLTQFVFGGAKSDQANAIAIDGSNNAIIAGSVSSAPPYILGAGNNTLGTPSISISSTGSGTFGNPAFAAYNLSGSSANPSGSESYAGFSDSLLLKYGSLASSTPLSPVSLLLAVLIVSPLATLYKRRRH